MWGIGTPPGRRHNRFAQIFAQLKPLEYYILPPPMEDISAELGTSRCHPQSLIWLLPSFAAAGLFIFPPFTPRLLSLSLSLSLHHTPSPLSIRGKHRWGAIDLITKKKVLPILFCPNHEDVTLRDPDCGNDWDEKEEGRGGCGRGCVWVCSGNTPRLIPSLPCPRAYAQSHPSCPFSL